jgi:hypothetical protein
MLRHDVVRYAHEVCCALYLLRCGMLCCAVLRLFLLQYLCYFFLFLPISLISESDYNDDVNDE